MQKQLASVWLMATALALSAPATGSENPAPSAAPTLPRSVSRAPVAFENDGVQFAGSIVAPKRKRPMAGIVLVPGSGPAVAEQMLPVAAAFAERGVAAIIFDKRGSGASKGSWLSASLDDLAGDAVAAARVLAERSTLEPGDIGLLGHSQGVFVITRAVESGFDAKFLIAVSGGGVSPRAVERDFYLRRLSAAGANEEERAEAMALVDRYFAYLAGSGSYDEFISILNASRWKKTLGIPVPDESIRDEWSWVASYDPGPAIGALSIPAFVVLGGRDQSNPINQVIDAWTDGLAKSPPLNDRLLVLPDLDHHLRPADAPGHGGGINVDPQIWDQLTAWIGASK